MPFWHLPCVDLNMTLVHPPLTFQERGRETVFGVLIQQGWLEKTHGSKQTCAVLPSVVILEVMGQKRGKEVLQSLLRSYRSHN